MNDLNMSFIEIDRTMDAVERILDSFSTVKREPDGKKFVVTPLFPPAEVNIYKEADGEDTPAGSLEIVIALAGYDKSELHVSHKDNYICLKATVEEKEDAKKKEQINRGNGIKHCNFEYKYECPVSKYDRMKTKVVFKNGLLTITVPPAEEAKPIDVEIN